MDCVLPASWLYAAKLEFLFALPEKNRCNCLFHSAKINLEIQRTFDVCTCVLCMDGFVVFGFYFQYTAPIC